MVIQTPSQESRPAAEMDDEISYDRIDSSYAERRQRNEDLARFIMHRFFLYWNRLHRTTSDIVSRYRLQEIAQTVFESLQRYPLLALGVAVLILTFTLPFLLFIFFTMTTAVMAFTGFVLLEGTLITAASMLLVGLLVGVFLMIGFVALLFLFGYFGLSRLYEYLERLKLADLRTFVQEL